MRVLNRLRAPVLAGLIFSVVGCGGGGGGGSPAASPGPAPAPAPAPPTLSQLREASRLASQATFGLPFAAIEDMAGQGSDAWLDAQFLQPATLHLPIVDSLLARRNAGEFDDVEEDVELLISFRRYAWWHRTMTAPDLLRQRVAFALSEIFVVSDNVDALIINPAALSHYNDLLLTHAFGNYRDLLEAVSRHAAMGIFLSHVNNRLADPLNNTFPDENYAREVMQLFSIGLFELEIDGTPRLDGNGRPVPTYGNREIQEFAKIFTGMSFGGPQAFFGNPWPVFRVEMQMFDEFHDPATPAGLGLAQRRAWVRLATELFRDS